MSPPDLDEFLEVVPVFQREDLVRHVESRQPRDATKTADATIRGLLKGGRVRSLMRNLYALAEAPRAGMPAWPDPYLVAAKIYPDGVLAYQGALGLHLGVTQPPLLHLLTQGTPRIYKPKGLAATYRGTQSACALGVNADDGILEVRWMGYPLRATSRERTLVDLLDRWDLVEEPVTCIEALSRLLEGDGAPLDFEFLLRCISLRGNATGAGRMGAFLERFGHRAGVPQRVLRGLEGMRPRDPVYWDNARKKNGTGRTHPRWNLVIPGFLADWLPRDLTSTPGSDALLAAEPESTPACSEAELHRLEERLDRGQMEVGKNIAPCEEDDCRAPLDAAGEPIQVRGGLEPEWRPVPSDSQGVFDVALLQMLNHRFGHTAFRHGQMELLGALLAGSDAVGILPTGGGKSLIYQMWAMKVGGVVLVISPLIALMEDQVGEARRLGLHAAAWTHQVDATARDGVLQAAEQGNLDLLFVAPESLFTLFWRSPWLSNRVSLVVVDEAHCISVWGHDFRPAYRDLCNLRHKVKGRPILALTATATASVRDCIMHYLRLHRPRVYTGSVSRVNLSLNIQAVQGGLDGRLPHLLPFLKQREGSSGLIYCATRRATEQVAEILKGQGIASQAYHAGMETASRRAVQTAFLEGECALVVATIAFGMGIHKPDIRFVVHLNLPASLEGYVQEVGRAGRDGLPADCLMLHSKGDFVFQRILASRTPTPDKGPREGKVDQLLRFIQSKRCRHQMIAEHFGQEVEACIDRCDSCQST